MKDKRAILFNKYHAEQIDEHGIFKLPVSTILGAMEEYANEKLRAFMLNYIGRGASRFEVDRLIKQFDEKEPF